MTVHAYAAQIFHLGNRSDSAVHRDDKVGFSARHYALQRFHGQAVSVGDTVGNEISNVRPVAECEDENGDRAYSVAVVVAEHKHPFLPFYCKTQSVACRRHSHDVLGGGKGVQRGTQKRGDFRVGEPPRFQQLQKPLGQSEFFRSCGKFRCKSALLAHLLSPGHCPPVPFSRPAPPRPFVPLTRFGQLKTPP